MRKLLFLLIICFISTSCKKDDVLEEIQIKFEVLGERTIGNSISKIRFFTYKPQVFKEWDDVYLPFSYEYNFQPMAGSEIQVSIVYLSGVDVDSFNLYIDGKLVDSAEFPCDPNGGFACKKYLRYRVD